MRYKDSEKLSALEELLGADLVDEILADGDLETKGFDGGQIRFKDMGVNGMNSMDTSGEEDYDEAVIAKVDAIDSYLSSQGAPLTDDQRQAFLEWFQYGEGQGHSLIEQKLEGGNTHWGTMAGEIQRTLENAFGPRRKKTDKSYSGSSRLGEAGNTWFDDFFHGTERPSPSGRSVDDYLDGLAQRYRDQSDD